MKTRYYGCFSMVDSHIKWDETCIDLERKGSIDVRSKQRMGTQWLVRGWKSRSKEYSLQARDRFR